MATVTLGNVSHTALITDPETGEKTRYRSTHIEQSVTTMSTVGEGLFGQMNDVINMWRHESDQPPAWVESDSEALAAALREHFGCGGKPEGWDIVINGPPALALSMEPEFPTPVVVESEEVSPNF